MTKKHPQRDVTRARIPVRVGMLERVLGNFNEQLGQKVGLTLTQYDQASVQPLRKQVEALSRRLEWLEAPLWRRVVIRVQRRWRAWVGSWHKLKATDPAVDGGAGTQTEEVVPPESPRTSVPGPVAPASVPPVVPEDGEGPPAA